LKQTEQAQVETGYCAMWKGVGLTDLGRVRSTNQDAFAVDNQLGVWIVADGMGGRAGGEVASQIAVESVMAYLRTCSLREPNNSFVHDQVIKELRAAIRISDEAIRKVAQDRPELSGMGTTIVIVVICPAPSPWFALAHVGDSRAYLVRSQQLIPLTQDHSVVLDLLTRGLLSPAEALHHPRRNVLMKAVGIDGQADPDLSTHPLEQGDVIVLCTDGVTKMLESSDILDAVSRTNGSPEAACKMLVDAANSHGGMDNITTVVISQN